MPIYKLTAYEQTGEKLLDESIEAKSDQEAKQLAETKLTEKDLLNKTHRLVTPDGKLLLFHV